MRKKSVNWNAIRQECNDFDLSEYRPEMRQEPGFYEWNRDDVRVPVKELEGEQFYFFGDPY